MKITCSGMTPEAIKELVNRRVEEALVAYEATRAANAFEAENQSQNGGDGDNGNGRNGNGENRSGGNGNPNENNRDARPIVRECTYQDFMKCQPLNFKGTKGVVGLTKWFKKMETVFHISHCPKKYQVKMVLQEEDRIERCVRGLPNNIQRNVMSAEPTRLQDAIRLANSLMDQKLKGYTNLTVKNNDLAVYTQRFQELTMLCTRMVLQEEDRIERCVRGLPNNIQRNVMSAEPTRLQDAIRLANSLMDQKLKGYTVKNAKNKRRLEVSQRDNHGQ
uniref:Reverse transcriptase domain-containing protein n=1 Tax=Tanacetum cinerariifolium TaxID=118510 RepID=A0A6L2KVX3_TANCI|nr:hypothetical protein [Tanacetum cinerariifolium]